MADKLWVGASGANWAVPDNWSPPGVPASGDTVTIPASSVNASGVTLDGLTINLNSSDSSNPATIIFSNANVATATTTFVATGTQAAIHVHGTLSLAGTIEAAQPGGSFDINGIGQLTIEAGAQVTAGPGQFLMLNVAQGVVNDGAVSISGGGLNLGAASGSGTVTLAAGAHLYAAGAIQSDQTIVFADATSVITLPDPGTFQATLSGLRPGDVIAVPGADIDTATYDPVGQTLTLLARGTTVAVIPVDAPVETLTLNPELVASGGTRVYTSDATRVWNGGTGAWFDDANWTTEGSAPASMPVAGDKAVIDGGLATIDADGVAQYGAVHDMTFVLGGDVADPGTLSVTNFTLDQPSSISVTGDAQHGVVQLSGANTFLGEVSVLSRLGSLTFQLDSDASLLIDNTGFLVGPSGTMVFAGGDVTNDGLITVLGRFVLDQDASLDGVGLIDIVDGGVVSIDGAVGDRQTIHFGDHKGTLILGDLGTFEAQINEFQQGDVIIVENIVANRGVYDSGDGVLTLYNDQTEVGSVWVWAGTVFDSDVGTNFQVHADGNGGTQITYVNDPLTVDLSIPVAALGTATEKVTLRELLVNAFGEVPAGFTGFTLSIASTDQQSGPNESYWGQPQQTPPGAGVDPAWYVNGTRVTADTASLAQIDASQIDEVEFLVGNEIPANAWFAVTTATDTAGNATQITRYNMWSVDPLVNTYQAGQAPVGPSAMVNSVATYWNIYNDVQNYDNCNWIADNVAAGLGATMPYQNFSNDPMENRSGGFWRIVHNGVEDPVADWSTLVQPGDVVRMGWQSVDTDDGWAYLNWHTTTIYEVTPDPDGGANVITVYDNIQYRGDTSYIGPHQATYWTDTVPESITIYRLDTDGQYLIEGNSAGEYIHGTVFNDLIRPVGGGATVTGGPGDDEIEGTLANLNGATLTDFTLGDWLEITDLDPNSAAVTFNPTNDLLTVYSNGAAVASFTLPAWTLGDSFIVGADDDGGTRIHMAHEARTEIADSAFLDANGWSYTNETDPAAAFGYTPEEVSPAAGEGKIVMGLMLQRANDPAALLEMGWADRQKALAAMEADGTLWTTYGADQQAYDAILQDLQDQGITVLGEDDGYVSSAASRTIWVELNAHEFKEVFGADLLAGNNDDRGRTLFWNGDLAVPESWNSAVAALWLDSNAIPIVDNVAQGTPWTPPQGAQSIGNANTGAPALTPQQIAALYNFPILDPAAVTGTIGVLEPLIGDAVPAGSPEGYFQAAFEAYRASLGIDNAATPFRYYVAANGGTTYSDAHAGERSMDVGILTAINPNANLGLYVGSGNDQRTYYSAFQSAIWDLENNPGILTSSFMDFVSSAPDSPYLAAYRELFVDAALRNMTLFSAADDGGSSDSIPNGLTNVIQAHTSPYAVLVGGTSLSTAGTAAGDPTLSTIIAQATAGDLATLRMLVAAGMTDLPQEATALSRTIETVWNQIVLNGTTFPAGAGYYDAAAGVGGVDVTTPTPSYQSDYGLDPVDAATGDGGRGVPDVSAASGGNLTYYTPNGDLTLPPTDWSGGYGTSAAAPLWAALAAQINTIFLDQGLPRLGYMNDLLYAAAVVAPASFNDITLGNNIASFNWGGEYTSATDPFVAIPEDTNQITPTGLGYEAGRGYDYVTGLGSPNGVLLARALTAIAHAQMNDDTPAMLTAGEESGWTATVAQSLLIQPMLTARGTVRVRAGDEIRALEIGASDAYAWSSQFAQQVLQPHFSSALVVAFDRQSQGTALEAQLTAEATFLLALDNVDMAAPQAALSNAYGFVDFMSDGQAVRAARAVAVAETAGAADDQVAIVRIRQNGVNDSSLLFYRVDDFAGTVDGLAPGDAGYEAATLARAYATAAGGTWVDGPGYGEYGEARLLDVDAGDLVAMRLRSDGHDFYAFAQANEVAEGRHVGHLWNYGLNTWGWEDVHGGGDQDYNDMVVQLDFTSAAGSGWLA
ncbi:hypothetical protein GXW78_16770 [Roseomonas terrae]|uniref:Peptidase S53 domain-containing protein n=1 Tax=Neoroseomonas terrae TaxID=424799 RepID=A0ABS5EJX3_9PROT|nr:hypothetical protein [Neoroseomonas terrae]MBR0651328.1 hypothetical protein [Neoroseomonas terrae]